MQSPLDPKSNLIVRSTTRGVEVDLCPTTEGIWLDKGELFLLAKKPRLLQLAFEKHYRKKDGQGLASPRTATPMVIRELDGIVEFHECPDTGGLWFNQEQWATLQAWTPLLDYQLVEQEPETYVPDESSYQRLPSLWLRTALIFGFLNLFLFLPIWLIQEYLDMNVALGSALSIALVISLFSFIISPWILDLTLSWLYKTQKHAFAHLPDHLQKFIDQTTKTQGIKTPTIHLILDGSPQAFTYGHTPGNARIVLSTGLIKLLSEKELEAVVAHEIGHAVHWDIAFMSCAQVYPTLFYHLYQISRSKKSDSDSKSARISALIYVIYLISEYIVLALSRVRELHADRFAAKVQRNPHYLSSALVKIGYGLIHGERDETEDENKKTSKHFEALSIMGINSGGSLMLPPKDDTSAPDKEGLQEVMKWDLWNPWSSWYELQSTHPLIAKRLRYLGEQSRSMGQAPYITFPHNKPESYWDEFLVDITIHLLPLIAFIGLPFAHIIQHALVLTSGYGFDSFHTIFAALELHGDQTFGLGLIGLGIGLFIRSLFLYPQRKFMDMSIASLLKKIKVSAMRPVPCVIKGTIIGKGNPGSYFSDDFYIQDKTGMIYLDHRTPLSIMEFFFGLTKSKKYIGKEVTIIGWYRRAPVPYVEIKSLTCDDNSLEPVQTSVWVWSLVLPIGIFLFGAYTFLFGL
ncbi:MAG: M48 family metalloprotease [Methylocystaceae bacterium]|nr:M48 family metalloprotease [Methylocystaceae bacterium]